MEPELIADYACITGEGPLWHPLERRLYWGDIESGRMFRYAPATSIHEQFYEGDMVGGFTIQEDVNLLLFMAKGVIAHWRDGEIEYIVDGIPGEEENRFNDVFVDTAGRVFCGTMHMDHDCGWDRLGSLYQLGLDGSIAKVLESVTIANGMGFTPDRTGMYFTDSFDRTIDLFDYDMETGALSNRRGFVTTPEDEGIPDGMTVDASGCVWSARYGGSAVFRYTPDGALDRRVDIPTGAPTSLTFGGDDYTDIYVTTAGGGGKAANGEMAGALFRLNLGIQGVPEFLSRVGL